MTVKRSASQILFGLLPTQTVDLESGVWRVARWNDPIPVPVDQAALRKELLKAVAPWAVLGKDNGLDAELRRGVNVEVVGVNEAAGVVVERFPRKWRCRTCGRVTTNKVAKCRCGSTSIAQMQHVAFHNCGALREPLFPECPTHHAVAVRLPGSARAQELFFSCPDCGRPLSNGFPFQPCACGDPKGMKRNVHRAAEVFSPHFAVMVNPPDPAAAARLRAGGGGARALEWVLSGLGSTRPGEGRQTVEGLIQTLVQQGISEETARLLAEQALARGDVEHGGAPGELGIPANIREKAEEEALSLASALEQGRVRIEDMIENTTPPQRTLYESYRGLIAEAGLSNVELLTKFPVATVAFGFTRGGSDPAETVLQGFRERRGLQAYGVRTRTEAVLFQLDPVAVLRWLRAKGFILPETNDAREARLPILKSIEIPRATETDPQDLGAAVLTLLHSYGHRAVRTIAAHAGVERDALAEYLLPHLLSVVIYTSARGQFVLGALQAMFETSLDRFLDEIRHGETRCPLDPGCRDGGGACMACLHLGEPSCRWFNRFLNRAALFGQDGYLVAR